MASVAAAWCWHWKLPFFQEQSRKPQPAGAYEYLVWGAAYDANASEFISEEHRQELIVSTASIHGDTEFAFTR